MREAVGVKDLDLEYLEILVRDGKGAARNRREAEIIKSSAILLGSIKGGSADKTGICSSACRHGCLLWSLRPFGRKKTDGVSLLRTASRV